MDEYTIKSQYNYFKLVRFNLDSHNRFINKLEKNERYGDMFEEINYSKYKKGYLFPIKTIGVNDTSVLNYDFLNSTGNKMYHLDKDNFDRQISEYREDINKKYEYLCNMEKEFALKRAKLYIENNLTIQNNEFGYPGSYYLNMLK